MSNDANIDVAPPIRSDDPMSLARAFIALHGWVLSRHLGEWLLWDGTRYQPLYPEHLKAEVMKWLESLEVVGPSTKAVRNTLEGLAAILNTKPGTEIPSWHGRNPFPSPEHIIPFQNGLLDIETDDFKFLQHSPFWLSKTCLPHPYIPDAECPEWERFLDEVFEGDEERKRALAQWFGYNLSGDTR